MQAKHKVVLCLDPGSSNIGYAIVYVEDGVRTVMEVGLVGSEFKEDKLYKSSLKLVKTMEIDYEFMNIFETWKIDVICMESFSRVPNPALNNQINMVLGSLASNINEFSSYKNITIYEAPPQKLKELSCGTSKASKDEVVAAVEKMGLINLKNAIDLTQITTKDKKQHIYDALSALVLLDDPKSQQYTISAGKLLNFKERSYEKPKPKSTKGRSKGRKLQKVSKDSTSL